MSVARLESGLCPVRERCGGCPLMALSPEAQREVKLARVRATLGRDDLAIAWVAGEQERYRRRIRMRVDEVGRPAFFNEDKVADCLVLTASLLAAVENVRGLSLEGAQHLEVRAPDLDGRAGMFVTPLPGRRVRLPELPGSVVSARGEAVAWQRWRVGEAVWSYVPLDAFLQVHEPVNRRLVQAIATGARRRGARTFVDPYCGAGNHALALAAAGLRGVAADRHVGGVEALAAAAREQELTIEHRAGLAITTMAASEVETPPDLLVANPPRAGLRDAGGVLAGLAARHVALVVCTSEALARDLAVFEQHHYVLEELVAFDMFPHTDHVELLAWLRRP